MSDLAELAKDIGELTRSKTRHFYFASTFIKIFLVIGGSVVAGVAHFETGTTWEMVGIFASVSVGIGGLFLLIADWDSSAELEAARKAIDKARTIQLGLDKEESESFQREREHLIELNRAIELYAAMDQMRSVVHGVLGNSGVDETVALQTLLDTCERSLCVASGFRDNLSVTHWTIGIFRAAPSANISGRMSLRCIAQIRPIPCDLTRARVWEDGQGVAGMAFASGREQVVPDILAPDIARNFDTGSNRYDTDATMYRSFVACPVKLDSDPHRRPWGVVVASSDQAGHFHSDHRTGVRTIEGTRAVGSMVAVLMQAQNAMLASKGA